MGLGALRVGIYRELKQVKDRLEGLLVGRLVAGDDTVESGATLGQSIQVRRPASASASTPEEDRRCKTHGKKTSDRGS